MKDSFRSVLIPIRREKRSSLEHMLASALNLVPPWEVELHFLAPAGFARELTKVLDAFPRPGRLARAVVHESRSASIRELREAIEAYRIDLLLIAIDPKSRAWQRPWAWERGALEQAEIPTLVVPDDWRAERFKLESLLVPLSGEPHASAALEIAIRLANRMDLPIDLLHVTPPPSRAGKAPPVEPGDQVYLEYPRLIDRMIAQGSPFSTRRERLVIREFRHRSGEASQEILKRVDPMHGRLLILDWKGSLAFGHAATLKALVAGCYGPVLLVRERRAPRSVLKVGKRFEAA